MNESTAVEAVESGRAADVVQRLMTSRVTYQDFASTSLPQGAIERAIQAAIAAPNHRMTEPWRFIRVGVQTRDRLAQVQARLKDKGRIPSPATLERAREKLLAPAELIVVCCVRHADSGVERENYAACACAIQNLCLSLWCEGIGSKWGTGGVTTDAETYQLLAVNPEEQTIIGFLSIGYPANGVPAVKPARKLGVSDLLRNLP